MLGQNAIQNVMSAATPAQNLPPAQQAQQILDELGKMTGSAPTAQTVQAMLNGVRLKAKMASLPLEKQEALAKRELRTTWESLNR